MWFKFRFLCVFYVFHIYNCIRLKGSTSTYIQHIQNNQDNNCRSLRLLYVPTCLCTQRLQSVLPWLVCLFFSCLVFCLCVFLEYYLVFSASVIDSLERPSLHNYVLCVNWDLKPTQSVCDRFVQLRCCLVEIIGIAI